MSEYNPEPEKGYPDYCPTQEHKGGFCCTACDHDYPTSCCCADVMAKIKHDEWEAAVLAELEND